MGPLPAFLLAAAALAAPAKDRPTPPDPKRVAELVRTVADKRTADADRRAAEDELKGLDPVPVLPVIVAELERLGPGATHPGLGPGAANGGGLALARLWTHYMFSEAAIGWVQAKDGDGGVGKAPHPVDKRTPQKKEAIGKALTDLLKGDRADETRRLILHGLRRNYAPAAEAPLAAILEKGGPDQVTAAEILLERLPKKYAAAVIDRVADPDRPAATRHLYLMAFLGGPAGAIGEADRRRLVRAGFALLEKNRGYFTACYLGSLLGREFKPDSGLAKYRGRNGLTDAFFADTVTAALAWWADHAKEFE